MDLLIGKELHVLVQPQPVEHLRHGLCEDHHQASGREQLARLHGGLLSRRFHKLMGGHPREQSSMVQDKATAIALQEDAGRTREAMQRDRAAMFPAEQPKAAVSPRGARVPAGSHLPPGDAADTPLAPVPSNFDPYQMNESRPKGGRDDPLDRLQPGFSANAPLPEAPKGFDPYLMNGKGPNDSQLENLGRSQCGIAQCAIL